MQSLTVSKRDPKRSRVFLLAQVDRGSGSFEARIRDISRSGALLESDVAPQEGAGVRLRCGDTRLDGRVAWAEDGCFGLEFVKPLLVGNLSDRGGAKLTVAAPRTYRRGDY